MMPLRHAVVKLASQGAKRRADHPPGEGVFFSNEPDHAQLNG